MTSVNDAFDIIKAPAAGGCTKDMIKKLAQAFVETIQLAATTSKYVNQMAEGVESPAPGWIMNTLFHIPVLQYLADNRLQRTPLQIQQLRMIDYKRHSTIN